MTDNVIVRRQRILGGDDIYDVITSFDDEATARAECQRLNEESAEKGLSYEYHVELHEVAIENFNSTES